MFSLAEMLGRAAPEIRVVDVGAMWKGAEAVRYRPLEKAGLARVVGFEPAPGECEKLNALGMKHHTYLPHFIGDGAERTFHLCSDPMTSSLYEPDLRLLSRFNTLVELTTPVDKATVQTRRLDDLPEVAATDLLKIDVQGAELDVLRGAQKVLATTLVVEAEVEFVPMYKDQPLFADVDAFLRARGFSLHTLLDIAGRTFKPVILGKDPSRRMNQVLWADAVYVRSFMDFGALEAPALLKLAIILHELYHSIDLAGLALQHYDAKAGQDLWKIYMARVYNGTPPPRPPLS